MKPDHPQTEPRQRGGKPFGLFVIAEVRRKADVRTHEPVRFVPLHEPAVPNRENRPFARVAPSAVPGLNVGNVFMGTLLNAERKEGREISLRKRPVGTRLFGSDQIEPREQETENKKGTDKRL